jgi:lipopolysaccharide/colanic/teichoic acid biosynthesis glycosyltransferase
MLRLPGGFFIDSSLLGFAGDPSGPWEEVGLLEMAKEEAFRKGAIHSLHSFEALLSRERARSDRTGSEFSLVVFPLDQMQRLERSLRVLQAAFRMRIRSIDEVGWFQDHTLGVLLPSTGITGARIFASDIIQRVNGYAGPLSYRVFSYPGFWYPEGIWKQFARAGDGAAPSDEPPKVSGSAARPYTDPFTSLEQKVGTVLVKGVPGWKRVLDVVGSLFGIIAGTPLFILICVYIRIVSPGRILFRQTRIGYKGRSFTFLKFRTMRLNNDASSHRDHLKQLIHSEAAMTKLDESEDPRIIPGARILRKACLDELPQLFNVLKGEMSLVGPRPCLPYEAEEYQRWHAGRFDVLPGITGLWQVSGKNNLTFAQMIRLDIAYANSMSLFKDLWILLLTLPVVAGFVLEAICRRLSSQKTGFQPQGDVDSGTVD